ncbi:MAG: hypothetical protein GX800_05875 [Clostridiaceae bacterium]|nr:hypothetical protein [Clostridiaceae bacterium]
MDYVHEIDILRQEVAFAIGKPIARDTYEIVARGLPHLPPTDYPLERWQYICLGWVTNF